MSLAFDKDTKSCVMRKKKQTLQRCEIRKAESIVFHSVYVGWIQERG